MKHTRGTTAAAFLIVAAAIGGCQKAGASGGANEPEVIVTDPEEGGGDAAHGTVTSQKVYEWEACEQYQRCCWAALPLFPDPGARQEVEAGCEEIDDIDALPDGEIGCEAAMGSFVPAVESWAEAAGEDVPDDCI